MKKKGETSTIAIFCFIFIVLVIMSFLSFSSNIQKYSTEQSYVQMENVASQTSNAIKTKMTEVTRYLRASADLISQYDNIHSPEAFDTLETLVENSNFAKMWIVTPNGVADRKDAYEMNISGRKFFKDGMEGNEGVSTPMVSAYGRIYVSVYVPIQRNDQVIGVLYGTFFVDSFNDVLTVAGFNGKGYAFIYDTQGNIIFSLVHNKTEIFSMQVFEYLKENAKDKEKYADYEKQIMSGKTGFIDFVDDGALFTSCSKHADIYDWNVMVTIPKSLFVANEQIIEHEAIILSIKMFVIFLLMACIVIFFQYRSRRKLTKAYNQVNAFNEKYKIVLAQTDNIIFDYDILRDTLFNNSDKAKEYGFDAVLSNAIEALVENGTIDKSFETVHKEAFQKIRTGEKIAEYETKVRLAADGQYHWFKVTLHCIFNKNGSTDRAVGVLQNIDREKQIQLHLEQELQYRNKVLTEALCVYEMSLDNGDCEMTFTSPDIGKKYFDINKYLLTDRNNLSNIHPDDSEMLYKTISWAAIKEAFNKKVEEIKVEARIKTANSQWSWIETTVHFIVESDATQVKAVFYVRDINDQKLREAELRSQAEHDQLTGLFNRCAAQRRIDAILDKESKDEIHALMLFDVDRFKNVNDTFGHMAGDLFLKDIAKQVTENCRSSDIICRLGGDEFVVFAKNVENEENAKKQAQNICELVRQICVCESYFTSISLGMAIAYKDGNKFEKLYKNADLALYKAKELGKDRYVVYQE